MSWIPHATRSDVTLRAEATEGARRESVERVLRRLVGDEPGFMVQVYDGTVLGPPDAATRVEITSPDFFHRVVAGCGSELSFVKALVAGDVGRGRHLWRVRASGPSPIHLGRPELARRHCPDSRSALTG